MFELQCVAVCCSMEQCVVTCCSVLTCVAVCCSFRYVANLRICWSVRAGTKMVYKSGDTIREGIAFVYKSGTKCEWEQNSSVDKFEREHNLFTPERFCIRENYIPKDKVRCRVLQCAAVCCSVLHCAAVCCSVLQRVAVCCSVLQCAAVCCSALQWQQISSGEVVVPREDCCS